jgi:magnesium chelatase family protein
MCCQRTSGSSPRGIGAYDRILKVARTIADMDGFDDIQPQNVSEAIQYRTLDRQMWM